MAENTKIEWTDHTFNPWWECTKVSPGCTNCYADALDRRTGGAHWGPKSDRSRTKPANWNQPRKWNRQAQQQGRRFRVFCASMADVFDDHPSILPEWREDLWRLIEETPHLDWLLLTKRPQDIMRMIPERWRAALPHNVWIGTSVVNQQEADANILRLLRVPAAVLFLSMEPLLGPVDLTRIPYRFNGFSGETVKTLNALTGNITVNDPVFGGGGGILGLDWIICGGESGTGARPMHPDWARSLRDQCVSAGVPFFFKQWGEWSPIDAWQPWDRKPQLALRSDGSRMPDDEWHDDGARFKRIGKKAAGRLLDERFWDQFPEGGAA